MHSMIFVNLPVKSFKRSKEFFTKLGYSFNPQFTDETSGCLILGENLYSMLIEEEKFKSFITDNISDASKTAEVLTALTVESREEVDRMVDLAVSLGGKEYKESSDLGFMYTRVFQDLDNHRWEFFWMDPDYVPEE
ncbi:MAG: VOC family protein [Clostridiaceae bacterium]